ncbi:MAG: S8 family serine peptidase [Acidobacteria bacterium]|nr:S8 family serine peptidase [Acidobacteriota bacterium]
MPQSAANKPGAPPIADQNLPDQPDTIYLNARPIDVKSEEAQNLRRASPAAAGGRGLRLVKFAGAIRPEWVEAVKDSGFEIVDYIPNSAYLVWGDEDSARRLREANFLEWDAAYLPEFKLQPGLLAAEENAPPKLKTEKIQIQLYRDETENAATLKLLDNLKTSEFLQRTDISHYVDLIVALDADGVRQIADRADVISIHSWIEPVKNDERQARIVTGFLSGNQPVAGNYLDYLASKGFTQQQFDAATFAVNVVDQGIDNGTTSPNHFALYRLGAPQNGTRMYFSRIVGTPGTDGGHGCRGHGTIDAHIIGGYVPTGAPFNAFPHSDANGFRYDLGIAPFVNLGSSVIFDPNWTNPNLSDLESQAYQSFARISNNSWGGGADGIYDADSQLYDFLVRDAQQPDSTFPTLGNQQYAIIFASGNAGPNASTLSRESSAKNVISVGASEGVLSLGGTDGCNLTDSGSDNASEMAGFSSRGPTADGRRKPDLVAPGTRITGGVAQASPPIVPVSGNGAADTCFVGGSVCGGTGGGLFFPANQQWYTTSSGTSHATPAVSGGAALVRQYLSNLDGSTPSPAMTKAILLNSASRLTGAGANDNLWSNSQGMGLMNLDRAFNSMAGNRILRDQADIFTASGQTRFFSGLVSDPAQPIRISLAWTDAPGSTAGNAYVNNLDLEVYLNGQLYRGNNFSGGNSVTGGTADARNNAESVFLPAQPAGTRISIIVRAANIAGDGVPGNPGTLDQDFALFAANLTQSSASFLENTDLSIVAESVSPANNQPDIGESLTVNFELKNFGGVNTQAAIVTLRSTGGITNTSAAQNYGAIGANGGTAARRFSFSVPTLAGCGSSITLTFDVQEQDNNFTVTRTYQLPTLGTQQPLAENFDGVTAPAVPSGWICTPGNGTCQTDTFQPNSAPNTIEMHQLAGAAGITVLESPEFNVNSAVATLDFVYRNNVLTGDGMVLEIKIGAAGAYQDIIAAGGAFTAGGYNTTLPAENPLAGRQAFGVSGLTFVPVTVALPPSAAGNAVRLRWRGGFNQRQFNRRMYVDSIRVADKLCATQPGVILAQPPTAWYTGDGDTRNHFGANDAVANGTVGYALGKVGQAFDLTNTGNSLSIPAAAVPSGAAPRTVEFWVYTRPDSWGTVSVSKTLFAHGTTGTRRGFNVYLDSFPNLEFTTFDGLSTFTVDSGLAQPEGWWHAAAVYDGATTLRFYVNGVERGSHALGGPLDTAVANLSIGSGGFLTGEFNGLIDEFTIYNRVLSATEVAAIYNAGINGKIKQKPTAAGANSTVRVGEATAVFPTVNQFGDTSSITLDPATLPALPGGYTHSGLAYELETLTDFSGTVNLCFNLPAFNDSDQFDRFRVLHRENSNWTILPTTRNFAGRQICAPTGSFSPFALAFASTPTAANVSVGGRVFTADGSGLGSARVTLTDANGNVRTGRTNTFGYFRFTEVAAGAVYVVNVSSKCCQFAPQVVSVNEEIIDLNLFAAP